MSGYPQHRVARTLAEALVAGVENVEDKLDSAGKSASDEIREDLFQVWVEVGRLIEPRGRWRDRGDVDLDDETKHFWRNHLTAHCLGLIQGRWGHEVAFKEAEQIEYLARDDPAWTATQRDQLLGGFLSALTEMQQTNTSPLVTPADPNPMLSAITAQSRQHSFLSAADRLLRAAEASGAADALGLVESIVELMQSERDSEIEPEVVWRLIPVLGRIGGAHGEQTGVLRLIVPTLSTYLVDPSPGLVARAIAAWADLARSAPLPSIFSDLLPIFIDDNHVVVIRALLRAAPSMELPIAQRIELLGRAAQYVVALAPDDQDRLLVDSLKAVTLLARNLTDGRERSEQFVLEHVETLDGHELEEVLRLGWARDTVLSAAMARARLRQVGDPEVNDRFNRHGDREMVDLLACGAGLSGIAAEDVQAVALSFGPERIWPALEVAETLWRANRRGDFLLATRAVLKALPATQAFESQRNLLSFVVWAAENDFDGIWPGEIERHREVAAQVQTRRDFRALMRGTDPDESRPQELMRISAEFKKQATQNTATAAYIRGISSLCRVASHLVRFDQAERDAKTEDVVAQRKAAQRNAVAMRRELEKEFAGDDPLASLLFDAAAAVSAFSSAEEIEDTLNAWARLPLPLLFVEGTPADRRPHGRSTAQSEVLPGPAVALVSINGQLLTGPAVVDRDTVYSLGVELQPGAAPTWATSLELEFVGRLGEPEVLLPSFSWSTGESEAGTYSATGTLVLRFALPSGQPAPPFAIAVRWRGAVDGEPKVSSLDVAGHSQIRLRPFDASRDSLTGQRALDERLLELYSRLTDAGYPDVEVQTFCRLFTAICRVGFRLTWDRRYRRGSRVTERQFHDDLFNALQNDPELEGRVERGSALALGFLDIRHDLVTAELKVERSTPVTKSSAAKYMGQPTQYAAADGSRLSILAILDMSPKELPIGTPENYLFFLHPAQHGLTNPEAPSLVVTVVVNGNLPVPSTWSRRRTSTQRHVRDDE